MNTGAQGGTSVSVGMKRWRTMKRWRKTPPGTCKYSRLVVLSLWSRQTVHLHNLGIGSTNVLMWTCLGTYWINKKKIRIMGWSVPTVQKWCTTHLQEIRFQETQGSRWQSSTLVPRLSRFYLQNQDPTWLLWVLKYLSWVQRFRVYSTQLNSRGHSTQLNSTHGGIVLIKLK